MIEHATSESVGLDLPLYSFAEADRLAKVSRGTAKRWLAGYQYVGPRGALVSRPPITAGNQKNLDEGVSFLDLIELAAIGGLREIGFSLGMIRALVSNCRELLQIPHPLVSLRFKTDGRDIFVTRHDVLLDVLRRKGAQAWSEVFEPLLETLDYQDAVARRLWPLGKDKPIVVDPDYGFGLPIIQGSGIRTEIILERFQAGDLPAQIAEDFNVAVLDVERALQFEVSRAAA
ncbi:MAG: DUF433 domain-containing protein [Dehalococcoidia bacterium]